MPSKIRCLLLYTASLSILFTLGKIVLEPTAGKRPFAGFRFPDVISLAGWELVDSQPLVDRVSAMAQYNRINAGRRYEYRQDKSSLQMEIRYVLNTDGDVMKLFQEQTLLKPISNLEQSYTPQGFYKSFATSEQLHLSSCINPRGNNTVTSEQFFHNRYTYDLQLDRLFAWGLGQENLIDQRCLWLHLSTPIQGYDRNQTLTLLENAWKSLTIWGQTQFPKP